MAVQNNTPTLTVFHTQHPGHTYGKYSVRNRDDVEAYFDYYRKGADNVARYIKSIMLHLSASMTPMALL